MSVGEIATYAFTVFCASSLATLLIGAFLVNADSGNKTKAQKFDPLQWRRTVDVLFIVFLVSFYLALFASLISL